ncbi:2-dehydropantoate 2-reductase [Microbacteriaceae bacterium 4G12]
MKIGIIGPGAIGLLFAYYLQKETQSVTVYTRTKEQADLLCEKGVTCIRNGRKHTVFPKAKPITDALFEDDYIFIAVKQYHLEEVLTHLPIEANLVFLQNGMSHLPILKEYHHVAVGIVEHGAKKESETIVHHTGIGVTRIGTFAGDFTPLVPLFSSPQFSLVVEKNWREIMTNKLIVNACVNPLTALYKVNNGELLTNPSFFHAMKSVFAEVLSVVGEDQQQERWDLVCDVCKKTASNRSSMLTDLSLGRQTEVDAILGYLLKEATVRQKQTPIVSFLYHSVKGLEG